MRYGDKTDEELVRLVLGGENDAYEELVRRHQREVILRALSVTHNEFMAEDAAQDAFVTAWMKLDMLREPEKFGAWVCRIARNRAVKLTERFREYTDYDDARLTGAQVEDAAEAVFISEEHAELRRSVERLPEKIKTVIYLHYFEGLSVAMIAKRMNAPEGTVKWQLSLGRQKLRGDLSAMSENENDTLVERVMKKIAELRLWKLRADLMGFEEALADVMADIDKMPDSVDKSFALADALLQGWLYRPGYKNDETFERIRSEAILGHNEDAMRFVVMTEDGRLSGQDYIEYSKDVQIPFLHKNKFKKTEGYEWMHLAAAYYREGSEENGEAALEHAIRLCGRDDVNFALSRTAKRAQKLRREKYDGLDPKTYAIFAHGIELRLIGGDLCLWKSPGWKIAGQMYGASGEAAYTFGTSSDSRFYIDGAAPGYVFCGSDGSTLTFESDREVVKTPAGTFDGCEKWVTRSPKITAVTEQYYKPGVGIVKQNASFGIYEFSAELLKYRISGGEGRMPLSAGNKWTYRRCGDAPFDCTETYEVIYTDAGCATLSVLTEALKNSAEPYFYELLSEFEAVIQNFGEDGVEAELSALYEEMKAAAKNEYERVLLEMAGRAASRMTADFTSGLKCWDHLIINEVMTDKGKLCMDKSDDPLSVSYTKTCFDDMEYKLLHNMVIDIWNELAGCLWCDDWLSGKRFKYDLREDWKNIGSEFVCRPVGAVTTAAGTFDDCVEIALVDTQFVQSSGWGYRGGEMEYTFARGIGIVRAVHHYTCGAVRRQSTYELTSYVGKGDGYMPVESGMRRRYECVDLYDVGIASSEYAFVTAPNGCTAIIGVLGGTSFRCPDAQGRGIDKYYQLREHGLM